ncbi:RsiV family protein, partial [Klebsiella pneumoniae]|uniref:RsiV family protein n=1 Tax=Klebsiella pneumoniae TaxID=573 RepID=UPI00117A8CB9
YKESIDCVLQDDLWYFDHEGITFISNPYELSAYAEGTLYFTVPYGELEGLKDEYSYDGGFQKSVALGETVRIDLNGDGKEDEITFDAEESSD